MFGKIVNEGNLFQRSSMVVALSPEKSMDIPCEQPSDKRYYSSVQILRGVAALAVVFFHVSEMLIQYTDGHGLFSRFSSLWYTGAAGVDLFFIISGFVMVQSTRGMFAQPGASKAFLRRRLVRIVPLYWLYSLIMLVLVLLPFTLREQIFSGIYTIKSFLFIPAFNPASGLDVPLLAPGWTLSYEMYFYLIFSLLLCLDKRFLLPAITTLFCLSAAVGLWSPIEDPILKVVTSPLLLEFALGCHLACLVNRRDISPGMCYLLIAGALLVLYLVCGLKVDSQTRFILWGLPASALMAGMVFLEKNGLTRFSSLMARIGDSSYSIYLSHIFIVLCVSTLVKRGIISALLPNDLLAGCTILMCIFTGYLSYRYIEQNFSRALNRRESRLS